MSIKSRPQHAKRYTPNQEKAMRLLEHSKDQFGYDVAIAEDRHLLFGLRNVETQHWDRPTDITKFVTEEKDDEVPPRRKHGRTRRNRVGGRLGDAKDSKEDYGDAWHAAINGDLNLLRRKVATDGFDIRSHREERGGATLLHYTSLYANLHVTEWIVSWARKNFGPKATSQIVNAQDTTYRRSTPLIEACRSTIGHPKTRLLLIEFLVANGGKVTQQDAAGDTALHWATRVRNVSALRFLLQHEPCAEGVSEALSMPNNSGRTPIDVAEKFDREKHATSGQDSRVVTLLRAHET